MADYLFDGVEFYHQELRLVENADEFAGNGPFDYLEASATFIREFIEENDWFTYTYDLGDDWQHRVTIEKIIDNWEFNYPQVIKYKGDCPIEDCGGIYGYYDCLDIISDENHPEYEERLEWMKSQGYPQEYDMEYVNQQLKNQYFYIVGKRETRCQNEIYEDHFSGKYGLKATKNDKNKNLNVIQSNRHKVEDEADFAGCIIWRLICGDCEMQEIFNVLDDLELMVDSEKELHILVQKINDLWNNTRKLLNRGYTPNEMRQQPMSRNVPIANNIVNFGEAKRNKVYPNDPCPCGSGKKYKNCCGNKK